MRRKGFTLIELLIVVAVLVTLMSLTFRLAGVGTSATQKNATVNRLQRLENCLSGYYAAYGSYPPVPLHNNRDVYLEVNAHGIQKQSSHLSNLSWTSVKAACQAQPVCARYPFSSKISPAYVQSVVQMLQKKANSDSDAYAAYKARKAIFDRGFDALSAESGSQNRFDEGLYRWSEVQVFQYGLLTYLMPRYLFMANGNEVYYDHLKQWTMYNKLPYSIENGQPYGSWNSVLSELRDHPYMITNLPSQAVCARWMPNLEGIVVGGKTFFGIDTKYYGTGAESAGQGWWLSADNPNIEIYVPNDDGEGDYGGEQYVLDGMTVVDGWQNPIYYYSDPPYQSYRLWSGGPNGRTFPPWVDLTKLQTQDKKTALIWMHDDIVHLSN